MTVLINLYATVRALPPLSFEHRLRARRDRSDPELEQHLRGFMGYVMRGGEREMTASLFHVLQHLERVQHHLSVEIEEAAFDALSAWAQAANAVLFLPDASVRDPQGLVLVDPETGEADPDARLPHPADAIARKERSEAQIAARGIPVHKGLPPILSVLEVAPREAPEILRRAAALRVYMFRGASILENKPVPAAQLKQEMPVGFAALSPKEQDFLSTEAPEEQALVNATWRAECAVVFQWALGLSDELPFPAATVDAPTGWMEPGFEALLKAAQARSAGELLDAADLYLRMHWAIRDARVKDAPTPEGLEPGVVAERHYALNWLLDPDTDWDEVDTPT